MHLYRQPVILFGIVIPILICAAIAGLGFYAKSEMEASFQNKIATYKAYEISRLSGIELEAQVSRQHQAIERWQHQLSQETASITTTNIREIIEHLPSKEIQQTAFEPAKGKAGFASVSAQNASQLKIAFRGTFRTMQRAFLELETRMPQLQLEDLRIDPSSTQSSLLNFQVSYTAWEN